MASFLITLSKISFYITLFFLTIGGFLFLQSEYNKDDLTRLKEKQFLINDQIIKDVKENPKKLFSYLKENNDLDDRAIYAFFRVEEHKRYILHFREIELSERNKLTVAHILKVHSLNILKNPTQEVLDYLYKYGVSEHSVSILSELQDYIKDLKLNTEKTFDRKLNLKISELIVDDYKARERRRVEENKNYIFF
jgi:hypothetical protein